MFLHAVRAFSICTAALTGVVLIAPAPALAWMSVGDREPSKYARHVACNEAWRASPAYRQQQCKLRSVHWDSYHDKPGFFGNYMYGSTCWVHIECKYGHPAFPNGGRNGKIKYREVSKLRRCKADASKVDTTCAPLTTQDVEAGLAKMNEQYRMFFSGFFELWCAQNPNTDGC